MQDEVLIKLSQSPKFAELVAKRNRFSILLSAIVLIVYYAFVLLASLQPALFAQPLAEGMKWPIGVTFGWAVLVFAFLMTGVYVSRANREFDSLNRSILEDLPK